MPITTTVHFPGQSAAGSPQPRSLAASQPATQLPTTVLLIDHESADRSVSRMVLEECGYVVLEATTAAEAMVLCECRLRLDLAVIDVLAPGLHAPLLIKQLTSKYPRLKVLYVSGRNALAARPTGQNGTYHFLQKPFMPIGLMRRVKEVLEAPDC